MRFMLVRAVLRIARTKPIYAMPASQAESPAHEDRVSTMRSSTTILDHFRFHRPHAHTAATFGNDWFALKAEAFARFFGTPLFLGAQTLIVGIWIVVNMVGLTSFDVYPFILLNLAFSLQAAYAAPLILLAQTRQAQRDAVHAEADAKHRESLAENAAKRQEDTARTTDRLLELLHQNTQLTELTKQLTERVEALTREMHERFLSRDGQT
jgi:uncharacterized membrane protein